MFLDNKYGAVFEKNRHGIYVWCSEKFAEVAGMDSPENVINKTDDDLIWRNEGNRCGLSDSLAQDVGTLSTQEMVRLEGGWTELKVAKHCSDGSHVSGNVLTLESIQSDVVNRFMRYQYLDVPWVDKRLNKAELRILADFILHKSPVVTAAQLGVSDKTIRNQLKRLMREFQVRNKTELVVVLNRCALTSTLLTLDEYGLLDG